MKVIQNSNIKKKKTTWKVVCPECDSVLEYGKKDVTSVESFFFYLHYIKCPCCGQDVDVKNW